MSPVIFLQDFDAGSQSCPLGQDLLPLLPPLEAAKAPPAASERPKAASAAVARNVDRTAMFRAPEQCLVTEGDSAGARRIHQARRSYSGRAWEAAVTML